MARPPSAGSGDCVFAAAKPVYRLKTRTQFQAVLAAGTLVRTTHFAMHRLPPGTIAPSDSTSSGSDTAPAGLFPKEVVSLGAMVPKRWAKRAVTRNAIKRQIYAVSARFEPLLERQAHVVRLRSAFDRVEFVSASSDKLKASVRTELLQLFERATGMKAPHLPGMAAPGT